MSLEILALLASKNVLSCHLAWSSLLPFLPCPGRNQIAQNIKNIVSKALQQAGLGDYVFEVVGSEVFL